MNQIRTASIMSMRIFVILMTISSLSCGGTKHEQSNFTDESIKNIIHLSDGKIYHNDSLFLGQPMWMKFHPDSFLIIQEYGTTKLIKVIDLKNNLVQELIPEGRGPGEMLIGWGIQIVDKDLYVFCGQLRKVIRLTPNDQREFKISNELQLDDKLITEFYPLRKDLFVGLNATDGSRLTLLNGDGKSIKKMGDFPPFQSSSNLKGDNDIFQSGITGSPDGNKIAVACKRTDIIEIYDLKNEGFKRFQGPLGIRLTVTDHGIGKSLDPDYSTYLILNANGNEFWASYNGYKHERGKQPSTSDQYPKQMYCFNWDGKPLRKIILDHPFGGYDIDWGKMILYTIEIRENYPNIVEYQLNEFFR